MVNKTLDDLLIKPIIPIGNFDAIEGVPIPNYIDRKNYVSLIKIYNSINANDSKNQLWYGNSLIRKVGDAVLGFIDYVCKSRRKSKKISRASERLRNIPQLITCLEKVQEDFIKNLEFYKSAYLNAEEEKTNAEENLNVLKDKYDNLKTQYFAFFADEIAYGSIDFKQKLKDFFKAVFLSKTPEKNYPQFSEYILGNRELMNTLFAYKTPEEREKIIERIQDPHQLYLLDDEMCKEGMSLKSQISLIEKKVKNCEKNVLKAKKSIRSVSEKISEVNQVNLDLEYSAQVYRNYVHLQSRNAFG